MTRESAQRRRFRQSLITIAALAMVTSVLTPIGPAYAVDGVIEGRVTTSAGGGSLPNVRVNLYSDDGSAATYLTYEMTDGAGQYSFSGLAYADYFLLLEGNTATPPHANQYHDGSYAPTTLTTFAVANSTPVEIDVEMDRGATLQGAVTGEFGAPANGVALVQHFAGGDYSGLSYVLPVDAGGLWSAVNVPPGDYSVRLTDLPVSSTNYRTQWHDHKLASNLQDFVSVNPGATVQVNAYMSEMGPIPTERLAGSDRYATAIAVSSEFEPFDPPAGSYVYIASGANYPDALSAAPAAAKRGAPLLLTPPSSLPPAVAAEITRLGPEFVVVAGGPGAVSNAVFVALQGLVENPANVIRIGGSDRYETSRLIVEDAFDNALSAFVATGRDFPDALAAGAAAARVFGPVLLIDGAVATAPNATKALIDNLGVEDLYIAGGTGVVSTTVEMDLATIPGLVSVTRLGGVDRYATSLAINTEIFPTAFDAYLATGTGFADALAGAALAGSRFAPLYTVRQNCIPSGVLSHFRAIEVDELYLLGGTGVLSPAVGNLVRC